MFCGKAGSSIIYFKGLLLETQGQGPVQHTNRRPAAARGLPQVHSEHQSSGSGGAVEIAPTGTFGSFEGGKVPGRDLPKQVET